MVDIMIFNREVCEDCIAWSRNKKTCPYRNMSLVQYLEYKGIPYEFKDAGAKLIIRTGNLMNSSAMIELNKEIERTRNKLVETGWDYKVVV